MHLSSHAYPELRLGHKRDLVETRAAGYVGAGATVVVDWRVSATVVVGSSWYVERWLLPW